MILSANKSIKERNVMQTLYLNAAQNNELIKNIGSSAVVVFTHYVAIAYQTNPNMEDKQLARLTGLSERTIKRTRLALIKLGWFQRIKGKYKGETQITYLVGKEAVKKANRAILC